MFHKPFYLNLINGIALLILFAVSLSVGVAQFDWSALFSLSDSQQVFKPKNRAVDRGRV